MRQSEAKWAECRCSRHDTDTGVLSQPSLPPSPLLSLSLTLPSPLAQVNIPAFSHLGTSLKCTCWQLELDFSGLILL